MDDKQLYIAITNINYKELAYSRHRLQEEYRPLFSQIQSFLQSMLEIEWEADIRDYVMSDIMGIMNDILEAYDNEDDVLMMDVMAYGVQNYLKLFLPEDFLDEDGTGNE